MFNSKDPYDVEIWQNTYETTGKFLKADPWKYFSDNNMLIYYVSDYATMCFCVLSKPTEEPLSIKIFEDQRMALNYLDAKYKNNIKDNDFSDYYFEYTEVLFDKPENIPEEQLEIYSDFNVFTNKEELLPLYILRNSGFKPILCCYDDLLIINEILEQVVVIINKINYGELSTNTNEGFFGYVYYNQNIHTWDYDETHIDSDFNSFHRFYLDGEELINEIKDTPINSHSVELDLFYLNGEKYCIYERRQKKLLILSFVDRETRKLLDFTVIEEPERVPYIIADFVTNDYIPKYGRMKKILYRSNIVLPSLIKLFGLFGIDMEYDNLYATDESINELGFM